MLSMFYISIVIGIIVAGFISHIVSAKNLLFLVFNAFSFCRVT